MWSAEGAVEVTFTAGMTTTGLVTQFRPEPMVSVKVPVAPVLVICQPQMKMDWLAGVATAPGGITCVMVVGPTARVAILLQIVVCAGPMMVGCADAEADVSTTKSAKRRRFIGFCTMLRWPRSIDKYRR